MTGKSKETGQMIDFHINRYEQDDREVALKIRPLSAGIIPSEQFVKNTRLQLLQVFETEKSSSRAA